MGAENASIPETPQPPVEVNKKKKGGELLVFDFNDTVGEDKLSTKMPVSPNIKNKANQKLIEESGDTGVSIYVSQKDKQKLEERHREQSEAEFAHYNRVLNKLVGDKTPRYSQQKS